MEPTVTIPPPIPLADRPHALYRFYDAAGALLYVGITHHPTGRWRQHRADKPWWHEVRTIKLEPFTSRRAVLDAETAAIKAETPRWNIETRHAPAEWPSMCWDSEEQGMLATLHEPPSGARLFLRFPFIATVDALVDLRRALSPCVNPHEGKPITLGLPTKCERGIESRRLFNGSELRYPAGGFQFKTGLRYKPGRRRMRRVLDEHFRAIAAEHGLSLCEDD